MISCETSHTGSANKLNRNGWTSWRVSGPPRFNSSTPTLSCSIPRGIPITFSSKAHALSEKNAFPTRCRCLIGAWKDDLVKLPLISAEAWCKTETLSKGCLHRCESSPKQGKVYMPLHVKALILWGDLKINSHQNLNYETKAARELVC